MCGDSVYGGTITHETATAVGEFSVVNISSTLGVQMLPNVLGSNKLEVELDSFGSNFSKLI